MPSKSPLKSILCLNGDLPPLAYMQKLPKIPIIAADGAANALWARGLTPDMIVGDLDSVNSVILETTQFIEMPDQDFYDFEKCITYMEQNDLLPTLILGINGGRLDHVLNNLSLFMRLQGNHIFYAPPFYGMLLGAFRPEVLIQITPNSLISIMGAPMTRLTSRGLKWELNDTELSFGMAMSCSNRVLGHEVHLLVHDGSALVLIEQAEMPGLF